MTQDEDKHEKRKESQEAAKSKKEQRVDDLRQVLSTGYGRRYLKGMLVFHGVFLDVPTNNNAETYKAIGRQNAGRKIFAEIFEANQNLAIKMFSELI